MTFIGFLILIISLVSCNNSYYKIPNADKKLIPYNGKEILVFKSNRGNVDTIFLEGYKEFSSPVDQWAFPLKYVDHRILLSKRTDPNYNRYLDSLNFVSLTNDGTTNIKINLTAKHSWFMGTDIFTKSEFLDLKDTTIKIEDSIYRNVIMIRSNLNSSKDNSKKRYHNINVIYWSKTKGLIRFDNTDSEIWEITHPHAVRSL